MSANATSEFVGEPLTEGLRVTVLTLGWLACVNGVFGNVLIITTLLSQQALRSVHNIYIANLAVADLILSGYLLPMWLLDLYLGHHPVLNAAHCLLNSYGLCGTFSASVLTLLAISVNRYVSVCHYHIFIRVFTKQRTLLLCVITWILGYLLCLPSFVEASMGSSGYDATSRICAFTRAENGSVKLYARIHTAAMLLLPAIIVGLANSAIYRHWSRSKGRLQNWRDRGEAGRRVEVELSELSQSASSEHHDVRLKVNVSDANSLNVSGSKHSNVSEPKHSNVSEPKHSIVSGPKPPNVSEPNNSNVSGPKHSNVLCYRPPAADVVLVMQSCSESAPDTDDGMENVPENNDNKTSGINNLTVRNIDTRGSDTNLSITQQATNGLIQHRNKHRRSTLSSSDISLIRSLLIVFVCCVLLYLPLSVITIVDLVVPQPPDMITAAVLCAFLNHSINWIVYGLMNRNFRDGYRNQLAFCYKTRTKCAHKL